MTPALIALTVRCPTDPCTTVTVEESLTVTALTPATISQQVSVSTPGVAPITVSAGTFRLVAAGTTFFVSTSGDDRNNCQSRARACATVNRAQEVARDGDSILLIGGTYRIASTIQVTKLLTIEPDGTDKVVLEATAPIIIFEVTAQGGPNFHVTIRNLTMGGNLRQGRSEPAILLINDGYTEIAENVIGAQDLPINK